MPKENEASTNRKFWKQLKEENFVGLCKESTYKRHIEKSLMYSYQTGIVVYLFVKYNYLS